MAGQWGLIATAPPWWRLWMVCCLMLCLVATSAAQPSVVYNIDLRAQHLADALNGLSEQTGVPIVFPYDLVSSRMSSAVAGRYTALEALNALLRDTGLSGGLSDKGVLTISAAKSGASNTGETPVTNENDSKTNKPAASRPTRLAALMASLAAAFGASAEEASDAPGNISEVLVTAQKRVERIEDVPVSVSAINADDLTAKNQVLFKDYYSTVPGLNLQPSFTGQYYFSIRGIGIGAGAPTTAVTIDDVPFGASTDWAGGTYIPDVDPGDLARVEVLRGPQGTLYGTNSEGGLIKMVTKDPSTDGYSGRLEAGTSSVYNGAEPGYTLRGSANIPVTDTFAMRVSGFTRQDPGYIDNPVYHLKGVNEAEADGARLSALWKPVDIVSLKLGAIYQHLRSDGAAEALALPSLGSLQSNYLPGIGGVDTQLHAYSAVFNAKLPGVDITSVTGYNEVIQRPSLDYGFAYSSYAQTTFGVSSVPDSYYLPSTTVSEELRLSGSLWDRVDWLVGGIYKHDHFKLHYTITALNVATGQTVGTILTYNSPRIGEQYAGFADLTVHFTDRFDVQLGARETHDSVSVGPLVEGGSKFPTGFFSPVASTDDNIVNYLLTPRLKLSSDFMLYARAASGYRPGGVNGALAIAEGAPAVYSPDKTYNYELGLKADVLDHLLSIDASVYYIKWKDVQISLFTPSKTHSYNANGGDAKSEGIELSAELRPVRDLTVSAWVDYDNAVLTQNFPTAATVLGFSGDRIGAPKFSGHFALEDSVPLTSSVSGFFGGEFSYVGDRVGPFTANRIRQDFPKYTKTDLHAGVRVDSWTASLYVNNLADTRGLLNGGIGYLYTPSRFYITPRTVGVTLVKTF